MDKGALVRPVVSSPEHLVPRGVCGRPRAGCEGDGGPPQARVPGAGGCSASEAGQTSHAASAPGGESLRPFLF